jgi:hypothetical protein
MVYFITQGASQNSTSSLHETVSARPAAALRISSPLPLARPLPEDRLVKIQSSREYVSGYEPLQRPVNQSDQKMLKLRIKVGSDNCLPELKTSAIYSNLGLDMSPSSSSEDTDSPSECERDFPDSLEEHIYSPSCIVRVSCLPLFYYYKHYSLWIVSHLVVFVCHFYCDGTNRS